MKKLLFLTAGAAAAVATDALNGRSLTALPEANITNFTQNKFTVKESNTSPTIPTNTTNSSSNATELSSLGKIAGGTALGVFGLFGCSVVCVLAKSICCDDVCQPSQERARNSVAGV